MSERDILYYAVALPTAFVVGWFGYGAWCWVRDRMRQTDSRDLQSENDPC